MTPAEILDRCTHLASYTFAKGPQDFTEGKPPCRACAEDAIAAAVLAERAACAEVAEEVGCANGSRWNHDGGCCESHKAAAKAIRSRGGK